MQKTTLVFVGTGIDHDYQALVNIYDRCGNLLCQKETYNGKLVISLKEKNAYTLIATSYNDIIKVTFYIDKCKNKYTFFFNRSIIPSNLNTITFLLTDANYDDLPIEKGEIVLWPK